MQISNKNQVYLNHYNVDPKTQRVYEDKNKDGQYQPSEQVILTQGSDGLTPISASELKALLQEKGGVVDLKKKKEVFEEQTLEFGTADLDLTKKHEFGERCPVWVNVINQYSGHTEDVSLLGIHYSKTITPTSLLLKESKDGGFALESHWNIVGNLGLHDPADDIFRMGPTNNVDPLGRK